MHHALLLRSFSDVPVEFQEAGVDTMVIRTAVLSIAEARAVAKAAYEKAVGERGVRTIVVEATGIGVEAQNSLLKVLEEPPAGTQFFFVLPASVELLPTLRSRFASDTATETGADTVTAAEFVALPLKDRLALIDKKTKAKDKVWQQDLLAGLEELLRTKPELKSLGETFYFVRQEIAAPGASAKMLLEHLALAID